MPNAVQDLLLRVTGDSSSGRRALGEISADLKAASDNVKAIQKQMKDFEGAGGPLEAEFKKSLTAAMERVQQLKGELSGAQTAIRQTATSMREAGTQDVPALDQSLQRTNASLNQVASSLTRIGVTWTAAITVPITGAAAASVKFAADFEADITKVSTLSGVGRDQLSTMRQAILDLAPAVGIGPDALAKALLVVTSTGKQGQEALDILTESAKLSAIGLGETSDVARTITAVITAYGSENINAARAAEILFKTVKDGGAEATQLAPQLGRVIAIAQQMGVSFEEVGANIATFTRLGTGADVAVTGLRDILTHLLDPSKKAKDALAEVGFSADQLRASIRERGLADTLAILMDRTHGNVEQISAMLGDVRGLTVALGTAGSQAKTYAEELARLKGNTREVGDAMSQTAETTAFKWGQLKAELEKVAIEAGTQLLPQAKELIDHFLIPGIKHLEDMVHWWGEMPSGVRLAGESILVLTAAGGPVLLGLGSLAKAITAIRTLLFGTAAIEAGSLVGILGWLSKMGAGAAGAVSGVAAAGGLVGGGIAQLWMNGILQGRGSQLPADIQRALLGGVLTQPTGYDLLGPVNITDFGVASGSGFVSGGTTDLQAAWEQARRQQTEVHRQATEKEENATRASLARTETYWDEYLKTLAAAEGNTLRRQLADIDKWYTSKKEALDKSRKDNANYYAELDALDNARDARVDAANLADTQRRIGQLPTVSMAELLRLGLLGNSEQPLLTGVRSTAAPGGGVLAPNLASFSPYTQAGEPSIAPLVLGDLAAMFTQLGQASGGRDYGEVLSRVGQTVVMLSAANAAVARAGTMNENGTPGRFGYLSVAMDPNATRSDRVQARIAAGAAAAQGASDVWSATESHESAWGNAGAGALAGAQAGAAFGPYGVAIGAAAGLIVGLVRGEPEWARAGREIGRDFGQAIGDAATREIGEHIADQAHEMFKGNFSAAEVYNMASLVQAAGGVTADNVGTITARLHDVFSYLDEGIFSFGQARKVLNENFASLVAESTDNLGFLSESLREIIRLDDERGLHTQAIADYVKGQSQAAVEATNAIINVYQVEFDRWQALRDQFNESHDNLADITAEAEHSGEMLNRVGLIAVGSFGAAVAAGNSYTAALLASRDGLSQIGLAYQNLGLTATNAVVGILSIQGQIAQQHPELIQGINGLTGAYAAMHNMGDKNVQTFEALEQTGVDMYNRLKLESVARGATEEQAVRGSLFVMQEALHAAEQRAKDLGVPLDANTQMLIDQSKELGIWKDKGKDATDRMIEGMQTLTDRVGDLVNALLGIPNVSRTVTVTTRHQDDGGNDQQGRDGSDSDRGDGTGAWTGGLITRHGVQAYGVGGLVRAMRPIPRGRDTIPAMLTENEFVVREPAVRAFGVPFMHAVNSGEMARVLAVMQSHQAIRASYGAGGSTGTSWVGAEAGAGFRTGSFDQLAEAIARGLHQAPERPIEVQVESHIDGQKMTDWINAGLRARRIVVPDPARVGR